MGYDHAQRGPWFLILFAVSAACFVGGWSLRGEPWGHYTCLGISLLMFTLGLSFVSLRVCDEADALAIRFGPLPLFSARIPYHQMRSVAPDRTVLLDGWGIHWIPGRGTTYNIWGYRCVRVDLERRTIRIGTDDVAGLTEFLRQKTGLASESEDPWSQQPGE
jgi:hypothetical protein